MVSRSPEYLTLPLRLCAALILIGTVAFGVGCADLADPLAELSTHPEGWTQTASENFHGLQVLESPRDNDSCQTCHGALYDGGTSGVGCNVEGCHTSYPHEVAFGGGGVIAAHKAYIQERVVWDITTCQTCHGSDFAGNGDADKNCHACHTEQDGPAACTTCHGSDGSAAPPPGLLGDPASAAVGAHAVHMEKNPAFCAECHAIPATFDAPGHLDGEFPAMAEVTFGALATADGTLSPLYSGGTCANTYCHGGFVYTKDGAPEEGKFIYLAETITGNNVTVDWSAPGQAECGTCHGLPPTGHRDMEMELGRPIPCSSCHQTVVDENNVIINEVLHQNGEPDIASGGLMQSLSGQ